MLLFTHRKWERMSLNVFKIYMPSYWLISSSAHTALLLSYSIGPKNRYLSFPTTYNRHFFGIWSIVRTQKNMAHSLTICYTCNIFSSTAMIYSSWTCLNYIRFFNKLKQFFSFLNEPFVSSPFARCWCRPPFYSSSLSCLFNFSLPFVRLMRIIWSCRK